MPVLEREFEGRAEPVEWHAYVRRMRQTFPRLFERLYQLYGNYYDFYYHVEAVLKTTTEMWLQRSPEMRRSTRHRLPTGRGRIASTPHCAPASVPGVPNGRERPA